MDAVSSKYHTPSPISASIGIKTQSKEDELVVGVPPKDLSYLIQAIDRERGLPNNDSVGNNSELSEDSNVSAPQFDDDDLLLQPSMTEERSTSTMTFSSDKSIRDTIPISPVPLEGDSEGQEVNLGVESTRIFRTKQQHSLSVEEIRSTNRTSFSLEGDSEGKEVGLTIKQSDTKQGRREPLHLSEFSLLVKDLLPQKNLEREKKPSSSQSMPPVMLSSQSEKRGITASQRLQANAPRLSSSYAHHYLM